MVLQSRMTENETSGDDILKDRFADAGDVLEAISSLDNELSEDAQAILDVLEEDNQG